MNTISKTHKRFSVRLRNSRVLENPEDFLGENFEAVPNFWLILDELSKDQLRVVNKCFRAFRNDNRSEWLKAINLAWKAAKEVVDVKYAYHAGGAAYDITKSGVAYWATLELIAMHKILEDQQKLLTFFPMILEVL